MRPSNSVWQGNFGYWQNSFIHNNLLVIGYTKKIREFGSPVSLERGGKTTRADLSAFKINVFHGVDHLYMPSRY